MGTDSIRINAADSLHAINSLTQDANIGWMIFKMAIMLLFVIAAIFLVSWLFKKFTNFSSSGNNAKWVQVISRVQVAPQKTIILVKIFQKIIAVMETPNHTTVLSEWHEDDVNYIPEENDFDKKDKFLVILKKSVGVKI